MNYCKVDEKDVKVSELFNNYYTIYEKRCRRVDMEKQWLKDMLDKDKWKLMM
jgi:hypothetical protein|tara:strand:+ start:441 stop:596 length:156 start_codon:yes stop_codon:yes gene_type:complete